MLTLTSLYELRLLLELMWYDDVLGQTNVVNHLDESLQKNRVPHAQLFIGKSGSGTLNLVLAYSKAIICHLRDGEFLSEGDEASLGKVKNLVHPDLHFSYPVNKTAEVTHKDVVSDDFISLWREQILDNPYFNIHDWYHKIGIGNRQGLITVAESSKILSKLKLKPFESDYKVMVIWMLEKMNSQAANKMLKMLEEPPERTIFLMVAENPDLLLPTIVSRTQIIRVPLLNKSDLEHGLISKGSDPERAAFISGRAHRDFRRALLLNNQNGKANEDQEKFAHWMRLCFGKKVSTLIKWAADTGKMTREDLKMFLEYGLHLFRESLIKNYGSENLRDLDKSEEVFLEKFAPFVNQANCVRFVHEFERAIRDIERNANHKILLFDLSIKVMQFIRMEPVTQD